MVVGDVFVGTDGTGLALRPGRWISASHFAWEAEENYTAAFKFTGAAVFRVAKPGSHADAAILAWDFDRGARRGYLPGAAGLAARLRPALRRAAAGVRASPVPAGGEEARGGSAPAGGQATSRNARFATEGDDGAGRGAAPRDSVAWGRKWAGLRFDDDMVLGNALLKISGRNIAIRPGRWISNSDFVCELWDDHTLALHFTETAVFRKYASGTPSHTDILGWDFDDGPTSGRERCTAEFAAKLRHPVESMAAGIPACPELAGLEEDAAQLLAAVQGAAAAAAEEQAAAAPAARGAAAEEQAAAVEEAAALAAEEQAAEQNAARDEVAEQHAAALKAARDEAAEESPAAMEVARDVAAQEQAAALEAARGEAAEEQTATLKATRDTAAEQHAAALELAGDEAAEEQAAALKAARDEMAEQHAAALEAALGEAAEEQATAQKAARDAAAEQHAAALELARGEAAEEQAAAVNAARDAAAEQHAAALEAAWDAAAEEQAAAVKAARDAAAEQHAAALEAARYEVAEQHTAALRAARDAAAEEQAAALKAAGDAAAEQHAAALELLRDEAAKEQAAALKAAMDAAAEQHAAALKAARDEAAEEQAAALKAARDAAAEEQAAALKAATDMAANQQAEAVIAAMGKAEEEQATAVKAARDEVAEQHAAALDATRGEASQEQATAVKAATDAAAERHAAALEAARDKGAAAWQASVIRAAMDEAMTEQAVAVNAMQDDVGKACAAAAVKALRDEAAKEGCPPAMLALCEVALIGLKASKPAFGGLVPPEPDAANHRRLCVASNEPRAQSTASEPGPSTAAHLASPHGRRREGRGAAGSAASSASEGSLASWISAAPGRDREPRCFLSGSLLWAESSNGRNLVQASTLQVGSFVHGVHKVLEVAGMEVLPDQECLLVELDVGEDVPKLTVTATHRIVATIDRASQTVLARDLKPGDRICCSSSARKLRALKLFTQTATLVQLTFKPDEPVEAFDAPFEAILSKGRPRTRRGRLRGGASQADCASIPDTEWEFPSSAPE